MVRSPAHLATMGALAALALCGCSSAPAPGLTSDQFSSVLLDQQDLAWQATGLDDSLRPAIPLPTVVSPGQQFEYIVECLHSAGFAGYELDNGTLGHSSSGDSTGASSTMEEQVAAQALVDQEAIAFYTCSETYPIDPSEYGMVTTEQLNYIYDYYATELIPCLVRHGFDVRSAPRRADFAPPGQHKLTWNPYDELVPAPRSLVANCTAMPPGYEYVVQYG
jgi:hypothetical protein